jgi:translation initiation factor 1
MSAKKKKKIADMENISVGDQSKFELSIGEATGRVKASAISAPEKTAEKCGPLALEAFIAAISRAALTRESSGRGGKVVTIASFKPAPAGKTAEELAKVMRKELGCGSRVEGEKIVLQGDMRDRAKAWLTKRGVGKIVAGN